MICLLTTKKAVLYITGLILIACVAHAESIANTPVVNSAIQNTGVQNSSIGTAQDWSLTTAEWSHYQKLMQGQSGLWYQKLSPPAVLGLNAKNPTEQQHFAALVAAQEHDKLAREIAFNNAVHSALVQLYPNEPIIKPFDLSSFNPITQNPQSKNTAVTPTKTLQAGDHIALFISPQGIDFKAVPQLIADIKKTKGAVLDIYCTGNPDDQAIQRWAKNNNIPADLVTEGSITLNHDNGQLEKTVGSVQLPYVLLIRNGVSHKVSLWSLS